MGAPGRRRRAAGGRKQCCSGVVLLFVSFVLAYISACFCVPSAWFRLLGCRLLTAVRATSHRVLARQQLGAGVDSARFSARPVCRPPALHAVLHPVCFVTASFFFACQPPAAGRLRARRQVLRRGRKVPPGRGQLVLRRAGGAGQELHQGAPSAPKSSGLVLPRVDRFLDH